MRPFFQGVTIITGGHYTHRQEIKCETLERIAREKGAKTIHYYINEQMQLFKITYAPLSDGELVITAIDLLQQQTKGSLLRQPDVIVERNMAAVLQQKLAVFAAKY